MCSGIPCLCLAFHQPYIVGGFANGQLRLYDCETGVKAMEVSAHARPVMALDVAPTADMVSRPPSPPPCSTCAVHVLAMVVFPMRQQQQPD